MSERYNGLYALIEHDSKANQLFSSLPDYVQEAVASRSEDICSFDMLEGYADSFLAGDK